MVLRIYFILSIVELSTMIIATIFEHEINNRKKRLEDEGIIKTVGKVMTIINGIANVIFVLYIVFALIYGIFTLKWYLIIPSAGIVLSGLFFAVSHKVEAFDFLTNALGYIFLVVGVGSVTTVFGLSFMPQVGGTNSEKYVATISIEEFKQVGYANVSGGRWYIKTDPSEAYYYEVKTDNGGTTTKHIDGAKSYVEKFQDDQYESNPHIDVYAVERHYTNWYDEEVTVMESNSYYIYIPSNSILFYDEK